MVIGEIQHAANRLGLPVFVVGAVARIILLENVHGLNAGRATTDVDFAFALDAWTQFHAIKTSLLENPRFTASAQLAHRVYFHAPGFAHPCTIDLVILLRSYHEAGNENRIYERADALAALEVVGYDPELAGAWLLGKDVATMASATTIGRLDALLNAETRERLIEDMSRAMKGRADALAYAARLVEQFTTGLTG